MVYNEATVTVTLPTADGKTREVSRAYRKEVWEMSDLVSGLADSEKSKYILDRFNYAHDLAARNKERAAIVAAEAGPDNAVAKLVAQITKQRAAVGKPVTEDEATQIAKTILGVS